MRKIIMVFLFSVLCSLFSVVWAQDENITITTYYPSPAGSYRELRSQRMAVGYSFYDANTHPWDAGGGCSPSEICNADLVVEGNVGIGTTQPQKKLEVLTSHNYNIDDEIRIGSYYQNNFYGLGLDYRIDANGTPTKHIVDYSAGMKYTDITLANGNVGIGNTNPQTRLHVEGATSTNGIRLPAASSIMWNNSTDGWISAASTTLMLRAGNSGITMPNNAPVTSSLPIGVTNNAAAYGTTYLESWGLWNNAGYGHIYMEPKPGSQFIIVPNDWTYNLLTSIRGQVVSVDSTNDRYAFQIQNLGGRGHGLAISAGSNRYDVIPLMVQRYNGTNLFYVRGDGRYYHLGSAISTKESKREIRPFAESGIGLLRGIKLVEYNYKDDPQDRARRIGFISNDENNVYDNRLTDKKAGFDTNSIVSVLIKAIQEQQAQIEASKKEIEKLKNKGL